MLGMFDQDQIFGPICDYFPFVGLTDFPLTARSFSHLQLLDAHTRPGFFVPAKYSVQVV